jgi:hypothetical protein
MVEKLKKRRIGKIIPLSSTNQKTAKNKAARDI